MKKIVVLTIAYCVGLVLNVQAQISSNLDKIQDELRNPNSKHVLVVSHRGDWHHAPENSIPAFQKDIEMGVDIIELDVQLTLDSQLVLMHDRTIDRTTSGKGRVADYKLAELKQFKLREGNGSGGFTTETIPTLEEAMLEVKGKVLVNVDKGWDYFDLVYDVLKRTGTTKQAIIKSPLKNQKVDESFKKLIKEVPYMPMFGLDDETALKSGGAFVRDNKSFIVETGISDTSSLKARIMALKQYYSVRIWLNSLGKADELAVHEDKPDETWGWLIKNGVNAIQTDYPKELLEYVRKKGLHD